ncbi:hypothetical protein [Lactiplantibacillus mudanjiangensis]|uniref:hypothetical protein n=1 Tax=Lactiplantibacillus mudanjiangensis TaxID=1296538 RepID=UPI001014B32B|nr:hypothetical protein [Lactiplantibacillus mudanjiangensis]VDG33133.1 hypothetical protein MUDAN_DOGOELCO_02340 [Lactiplantibacillus mudanjiangensis]
MKKFLYVTVTLIFVSLGGNWLPLIFGSLLSNIIGSITGLLIADTIFACFGMDFQTLFLLSKKTES